MDLMLFLEGLVGVFSGVMAAITIFLTLIAASVTFREAFRRLFGSAPAAPKRKHTSATRPPKFAEWLLYFLPKKDREALLGDLEEEYYLLIARFSKRKAVIWYYAQVLTSFWPYICHAARKLAKWGALGWFGDIIRRLVS